jgi:hypothetical protein
MSFVKIDTNILYSSLWVERELRSVFITALVMAVPSELREPMPQIAVQTLDDTGFVVSPGWYGFGAAAGSAILLRDGSFNAEGWRALERLCAPDPDSRSQEYEGRRMARINGGYLVLNYMRYRDFDHSAADRMRRMRHRRKTEGVTPNGDTVTPNVTHGSTASASASEVVALEKQELPATAGQAYALLRSAGLPEFGLFSGIVEGFLRSQQSLDAVVATLKMHLQGEMAHVQATPEQLGLAVQQYSASTGADRFNPLYFAGFVRRAIGNLRKDSEEKRIVTEGMETRERAAEEENAGQFVARFANDRPQEYEVLLLEAEQAVGPGMGRSFLVHAKLVELVREALNATR